MNTRVYMRLSFPLGLFTRVPRWISPRQLSTNGKLLLPELRSSKRSNV